MKNRILLLLVSLCTMSMMAQEGDTEAVKKEIRDIKLSEKYIYGEGTSAKSLEIAHDIAAEKMHVNILTLLTDEGYTSKDANTRWEQLQSSLKCLEYHQGPLYKSFVFLPEVALLKEVAADETETPAEETTTDPVEIVETVEEVAPPAEEIPEPVVVDTIENGIKLSKVSKGDNLYPTNNFLLLTYYIISQFFLKINTKLQKN